jgi:hypothetical protein
MYFICSRFASTVQIFESQSKSGACSIFVSQDVVAFRHGMLALDP